MPKTVVNKYVVKLNPSQSLRFIVKNGGTLFSFDSNIMSHTAMTTLAATLAQQDEHFGQKSEAFDETKENTIVCKECGSHNVDLKGWVNQLDGGFDMISSEDADTWCHKCAAHNGTKNINADKVPASIQIYPIKRA